ncbi:MAG TPA: hypothetical protein VLB84_07340 [Bacteroidia bacterium]|jgi:hypothetical protein|nr:hypothetical protein [Bacteroidia bacterium]
MKRLTNSDKKKHTDFIPLEKTQLAFIIGGSGQPIDPSENTVLKTTHDTAKNSIGNIR